MKLSFEKKARTIGNKLTKNGKSIYYKRIKRKMDKVYFEAIGFNADVVDKELNDDDWIGVMIENPVYGRSWKVVKKTDFMKYAELKHFNKYEPQYFIEESYLEQANIQEDK